LLDVKFDEKTADGRSPLRGAVQNGFYDTVKYMLESGCDVTTNDEIAKVAILNGHCTVLKLLREKGAPLFEADEDGDTPVQLAILYGTYELFSYLVQQGCSLESSKRMGPLSHIAARKQNLEVLKYLAENTGTIDEANPDNGETALLVACQRGPVELVEFLLEKGCNPSHRNHKGVTPALRAASCKLEEVLQILAEKNADLVTPNLHTGDTAILAAARNKSLSMVRLLAEAGIKLTTKDRNGKTVAFHAAETNNAPLLRYLQQRNVALDEADITGTTPLMMAVRSKAFDAVKYLTNTPHACDVNHQDSMGRTALHYAVLTGGLDIVKHLHKNGADLSVVDEEGNTPLLVCLIHTSNLETLKYLALQGDKDLQATNDKLQSALHIACTKTDNDAAMVLLEAAFPTETQDKTGSTPFMLCAAQGSESLAIISNAINADVNRRNFLGENALHLAAKTGNAKIVRYFAMFGCRIDQEDKMGITPLMIACFKKNPAMAEFLISKGADVNTVTHKGRTPAHFACYYGSLEILKLLHEHSAELDKADLDGVTPILLAAAKQNEEFLSFLCSQGCNLSRTDHLMKTALHFAVSDNNESVIDFLISKGLDPNALDESGTSPVLLCVKLNRTSTLSLLSSKGLNVTEMFDNNSWSVAHYACQQGNVSLLKEYLKGQLSISSRTADGENCLTIACLNGQEEVLKFLLEQRPNINYKNARGQNSLHIAAQKSHLSLIPLLLEAGIRVSEKDNEGNNVLHILSSKEFFCYKAGVSADEVNKDGRSALHFACACGSRKVINLLLKNGAAPNLTDSNGETPIFTAIRHRKIGAVQLLLRKGANPNVYSVTGDTPMSVAVALNETVLTHILQEQNGQFDKDVVLQNVTFKAIFKAGNLDHFKYLVAFGFDGKKKQKEMTLLHHIIFLGDANLLKELIKFNRELAKEIADFMDADGDTALHLAIMRGRLDMARVLLQLGCRTDLRNNKQHSVLHVATIENKLALVKWVCDNCPSSCQPDTAEPETRSPLHLAAIKGNLEVFKFLEQKGFSAATKSKDGMNCAHFAAIHGNLHVLQHIRNANRDAVQILTQENASGFTPIRCAVLSGHENISNLLYELEPSLPECIVHQALALGNQHMVDWVEKRGVELSAIDPATGETSLRAALNDSQTLNSLNAANNHGNTPAQKAAARDLKHILVYLKEQGAQLDIPDAEGDTPLFDCALNGHLDAMKMLIEFGCDSRHTNQRQRSIVHVACIGLNGTGHLKILRFVNEQNLPLDEEDVQGNTGLMYACRQGFKDIADFLLTSGQCDPSKPNQQGSTAAHLAAIAGRSDILDALSQHGARLDAVDSSGATPLMIAVHRNNLDCVKLLAEKAGIGEGSSRDRLGELAVWASAELETSKWNMTHQNLDERVDVSHPQGSLGPPGPSGPPESESSECNRMTSEAEFPRT
uniref:ANK_REP_REGION domain-containing protein n=1 Tax=Macrostomum lignano TaxID=282301 RepID=A0A1I8G2Q1_9PLAT